MSSTPPRVARKGHRLAPGYKVVEHISRGKSIDVYDVWSEERLTRCVAKTPRPDMMDHARTTKRLLAEGRLTRRLTHPHIVRCYEVLKEPRPMVVLEPLTGATLDSLIHDSERRLSGADIAALGQQMASALEYMHNQGVIHVDLKPSNVLVDAGRATIIDLGLARRPGRISKGVGTAAYLSPEQARGERVDAATDVWGLGCMLYEAATAMFPFETDPSADGSGADRVAEPLSRYRRLPTPLRELIAECMELQPERRPSMKAVWDRLGAM